MAGSLTISTLKDSSGVLATQNGMTGIAKSWVVFDGATGSTTTIKASFNVSSVTYTSGGTYVVNFTTAMPSANYAISGSAGWDGTNYLFMNIRATGSINTPPTASSCTIYTSTSNGTNPSNWVSAVFDSL